MRGKRSKQYRKLMQQYGLTFGFREPYQVLVDAEMIQDTARFKMDLVAALRRTLHGEIKPMITQCSMRHLYALPTSPQADAQALIALARTFERRRCDHHTLPSPLSTLACLSSVLDPKSTNTNKHRYVVASQDVAVRKAMRAKTGVPLVYVKRSVMVMEPMSERSEVVREGGERGKLRSGLVGRKRKREEAEAVAGEGGERGGVAEAKTEEKPKKKRARGPKGPNPLSIKKPKKQRREETVSKTTLPATEMSPEERPSLHHSTDEKENVGPSGEPAAKRKRKRRHKPGVSTAAGSVGEGERRVVEVSES